MLFDACSVPKMREFWLSLSTAKQILKFEFPSARPWTPISVPYCRARFSYHHIHHNSFPTTKYLNLEASCSSIQRLCKRVHEMCTKRGVFGLGVFTLSKNSSPCPISYRQQVLPPSILQVLLLLLIEEREGRQTRLARQVTTNISLCRLVVWMISLSWVQSRNGWDIICHMPV